MMASFMSYFGGRKDAKQATRDAIVTLRQQLQMLEKKEEHLQKKVDEELKKARANAVTNKSGVHYRALLCTVCSKSDAYVVSVVAPVTHRQPPLQHFGERKRQNRSWTVWRAHDCSWRCRLTL